jgi:hypothetical protein
MVAAVFDLGAPSRFAARAFGAAVFGFDAVTDLLAAILATRVFGGAFFAFFAALVFALAVVFAVRGFLLAARFTIPTAIFAAGFLAPDFLLVLLRPLAITYSSHFKKLAAG